jgi:hypothetical protein
MNSRKLTTIRQENRVLRDKIAELNRSLDLAQQDRHAPSVLDSLEGENKRLRADLVDKEREFARQSDQLRHIIQDKDNQSNK